MHGNNANPNDPLWGKCKINCHGLLRILPTTICTQMNGFKNAHEQKIQLLKRKLLTRNTLLLYGPPGTGKSTLAKIFAKTVNCKDSFIKIKASSLVTVEQGSGATKIQQIFEEAKKSNKPTVILIEEVDSIADITHADLNKNQDRQAAYKELDAQLDDIEENDNIFVICTTNYIHKCAEEFLDRFEAVEIPLPTRQERIDALRHFFFYNNVFELNLENIKKLCHILQTKAPETIKEKVNGLHKLIDEIESSFTGLAPFDRYKGIEITKTKNHIDTFKEIVIACIELAKKENKLELLKNEFEALDTLHTIWILKYNTYLFITPPSELFDSMINQTEKTSLRFLKYLAHDILVNAQHHNQCQIRVRELVNTRIQIAKARFNNKTSNTKEIYEAWQKEILDTQRGIFVIQSLSAIGNLGIQGLTHAHDMSNGLSYLYQAAQAHPYIAAGLALGTVCGGYALYKWIKEENQNDESSKNKK
jgi:SpoVK/Ycf46/Vps4 family AAA+-type ATPase